LKSLNSSLKSELIVMFVLEAIGKDDQLPRGSKAGSVVLSLPESKIERSIQILKFPFAHHHKARWSLIFHSIL